MKRDSDANPLDLTRVKDSSIRRGSGTLSLLIEDSIKLSILRPKIRVRYCCNAAERKIFLNPFYSLELWFRVCQGGLFLFTLLRAMDKLLLSALKIVVIHIG